jgi:hypothetical protein
MKPGRENMIKDLLLSFIIVCVVVFSFTGTRASDVFTDDEFDRLFNDKPVFENTTEEPVLLRYHLTPGQIINFDSFVQFNISSNLNGRSTEVPLRLTVYSKCEVIDVDEDGTSTIDLTFTRLIMKVEYSNIVEDSDDENTGTVLFNAIRLLVNTPVRVTMDATGEILEADISSIIQRVENSVPDEELKQKLLRMPEDLTASSIMHMPNTPVKAGDTFESGYFNYSLLDFGRIRTTLNYTIEAADADGGKALLRVSGKTDVIEDEMVIPFSIGEQSVDGWLLFDMGKGYVTHCALEITAEGMPKEDIYIASIKQTMRMFCMQHGI